MMNPFQVNTSENLNLPRDITPEKKKATSYKKKKRKKREK